MHIVTFLMVFLIQNGQNRNLQAIHLKLDVLLRTTEAARTRLVNLERLSDEDLTRLQSEFERLHDRVDDPLAEYVDELSEAVEKVEQARAGRHERRVRYNGRSCL